MMVLSKSGPELLESMSEVGCWLWVNAGGYASRIERWTMTIRVGGGACVLQAVLDSPKWCELGHNKEEGGMPVGINCILR